MVANGSSYQFNDYKKKSINFLEKVYMLFFWSSKTDFSTTQVSSFAGMIDLAVFIYCVFTE